MAARPRAHGFTLIELLVVVALVAVLTATVVLSIPSRSSAELQQREAQRLQARMEMAREEAVLRARTFGLRVEPDGYVFLRHGDIGWQPFDDGHPLDAHRLPRGLRLELDVEGAEAALESAGRDDDANGGTAPQILFLAGGEILPDYTVRVLGEGSGTDYSIAAGEEAWVELGEARH